MLYFGGASARDRARRNYTTALTGEEKEWLKNGIMRLAAAETAAVGPMSVAGAVWARSVETATTSAGWITSSGQSRQQPPARRTEPMAPVHGKTPPPVRHESPRPLSSAPPGQVQSAQPSGGASDERRVWYETDDQRYGCRYQGCNESFPTEQGVKGHFEVRLSRRGRDVYVRHSLCWAEEA